MASPPVPFAHDAQRLTERQWQAAVGGLLPPGAARPLVRASWERSQRAAVRPDLRTAPIALDEDALHATRERVDWLPFARRAVGQLHGTYGVRHVLTMFDAAGRMLAAEGDPRALDGLAEINFRPGGDWAEGRVGTNGPGTALALGRPVHIVGAEHFCAQWQAWHCAAVPLRDQVTGAPLGVLDLSGPRDYAHPHTLDLVAALAVAVEQMLASRDVERRYLVLRRCMELSGRVGGEALVAVDRGGSVLFAAGPVPDRLRGEGVLAGAVRRAVVDALGSARDGAPREVFAAAERGAGAAAGATAAGATAAGAERVALPLELHPVLDGMTPVGAVLHLRAPGRAAPGGAAPRPAPNTGAPAAGGAAPGGTRYSFYDLVGQSPALAEACRVAAAAAMNALPVLITGESGTGKEVFAQSIHRAGARGDRPFVAVNCAALPRELVESELFGYAPGAFSGARREGSPGKFLAADGGTIFLDEIGELPPAAQAALLRVLQEGEITAVGSTRGRPVDVRVIAATNRDVRACLASGRLREDLYYRLDVLGIGLPPLRERRGDVGPLARRFLAAAGADLGRPGHTFAPDVLDLFERYPWPGNVRELKNVVRRLVALCPTPRITRADLSPEFVRAALAAGPAADAGAAGDAGLYDTGEATPAYGAAVGAGAADDAGAERARTVAAVRAARTMGEAALHLGVTRSTLYRRLARYGMRTERTLRHD